MSLLQPWASQKSSEAAASRKKRHVNQARPTQNRQVQLSPGALEEPGGARRRAGQDRAGQGRVAWAVVADVHEDGEVRLASGCSINGALGQVLQKSGASKKVKSVVLWVSLGGVGGQDALTNWCK